MKASAEKKSRLALDPAGVVTLSLSGYPTIFT